MAAATSVRPSATTTNHLYVLLLALSARSYGHRERRRGGVAAGVGRRAEHHRLAERETASRPGVARDGKIAAAVVAGRHPEGDAGALRTLRRTHRLRNGSGQPGQREMEPGGVASSLLSSCEAPALTSELHHGAGRALVPNRIDRGRPECISGGLAGNLESTRKPRFRAFRQAGDGARTHDPQLGKLMLYQLSYARVVGTF